MALREIAVRLVLLTALSGLLALFSYLDGSPSWEAWFLVPLFIISLGVGAVLINTFWWLILERKTTKLKDFLLHTLEDCQRK